MVYCDRMAHFLRTITIQWAARDRSHPSLNSSQTYFRAINLFIFGDWCAHSIFALNGCNRDWRCNANLFRTIKWSSQSNIEVEREGTNLCENRVHRFPSHDRLHNPTLALCFVVYYVYVLVSTWVCRCVLLTIQFVVSSARWILCRLWTICRGYEFPFEQQKWMLFTCALRQNN